MPLVDLQTDLTSLKFGNDRPGGGSSRQPFVKGKSLDKRIAKDGIETLGRTGGPDMFIRGGFQVASSVADDLLRLGKYFTTVRGGLFLVQQNALSAIGTRIYGGYPIAITGPNSARLNDGVYTPLSTLAAATGNAFGYHPNKQGVDFTGTSTTLSRPEYINLVKGNLEGLTVEGLSINLPKNNRLVNLYNNKIIDPNGSTSNELFSYKGGPGIGVESGLKTIIKTASDRTPLFGRSGASFSVSYATLNNDQQQSRNVVGSNAYTPVNDFRKDLKFKPTSFISDSPDYDGPDAKNIEKRVNLGDPGKRGVDRSNYTRGIVDPATGQPKPLDTLNALYLYKSEGVTNDKRKNDLVKFRIAIVDNEDPKQKVFAHFRAFINSFSDNMSATWNSFKYAGRGEDFYTYQGFQASYNMSFTVVAQSIQELSIMYQKLNYIKSSLAPDYSKQGYMRGNIAQLTMGGYIYEMPGIIESFNITIPQDTTWEIGIPASQEQSTEAQNSNGFTDSNVKELPHRVEVEMSFKPIYKFLPEKVKNINGKITQRFISLEDAEGSLNNLYDNGVPLIYRPGTTDEGLPNLVAEDTVLEEVPEDIDTETFQSILPTPVIEVGPVTGEMVDYGNGNFINTNGQFGLRNT